jgi:N-acetyl-anhydromuramyl-L-alanine amidase AmpD
MADTDPGAPAGPINPIAEEAAAIALEAKQNPYLRGSGGMMPAMLSGMTFGDVGSSGLRQYSGWVREEFLSALVGQQGARVYREMTDNSPTVGAVLFAIAQSLRKVEWRVEPANDTPAAQEMADFADSLRFDMSDTWENFVTEALTMLQYGFAPMEIIYKARLGDNPPSVDGISLPRSRFNDGRIGIRRMPLRGQDTVIKWFLDPSGEIKGLTQQPYTGSLVDIPINKLLLFRPTMHKNNPEGRPLPLNTKVRTPDGWTTMGDIAVGDQVYDETGAIRHVTGKSETFQNRPVYEIEFTTGATIRADACHLWRVSDYNDRTHGRVRDLTTEQIARAFDVDTDARKLKGPSNERWRNRRARSICCGIAPVIEAADLALPLDPYVLGYWLGDGITNKAAISVQGKDTFSIRAELEKHGYRVNHDGNTTANVAGGLLFGLRAAGVFDNKHVPRRYMEASPAQRLALLQGLMDSDGYSPGVDSKDEASTFANTNMRLVDAVVELVRSLGGQPRVRVIEEAGALGGVINGKQIVAKQSSYEVRFMLSLPVHRLPRKRHAQVLRRTLRNSGHFIRSVQRVENDDTICIEVDSPSHLFLAGEAMIPTHNSILRNSFRSYNFIRRLEEQEAIMVERFGGLPCLYVPNALLEAAANGDANATSALNTYKKIITNVRIDEQMGVILPSDTFQGQTGPSAVRMYEFELKTPTGRSSGALNTDVIIARYKLDIMTSVLADFLTLGHSSRGTQSLSLSKVDMFFQAIEGWVNGMAAVLNRHLLPRIWRLNALDVALMPEFQPDLAQRIDLDSIGNYVLHLAQGGMQMFPDPDLENYLRDAAGMPDISDESAYAASANATDPEVLKKMLTVSMARRVKKLRHG